MDRDEILDALRHVGQRLQQRGLVGELYVVGGAAMALAYNTRRSTRDIDAVFEPKREIYEAARVVGEERSLDPDWLNDSVKGLLSGPDPYETPIIELPGLRCLVASPQMLLALKVLAHRAESDADDVALLIKMLGLTTTDGSTLPSGSSRPGS
ncbi:MAG: DUF6036 family nucleotidyltransferase [Egibacteraceae bacterium]